MRDALGGTVNLVIIVFFIVFGLGYLAFNINYTKAFRLKDKVVATYNKFNGKCDYGCVEGHDCSSICLLQIKTYAQEIGYSRSDLDCSIYNVGGKVFQNSGTISPDYKNYFCYRVIKVSEKKENDKSYYEEGTCRFYVEVITSIYTELPVINQVLDVANQKFTIRGNTKIFTASSSSTYCN